MECCLRYASPKRIFRVIPAAKIPSSRHQLRNAHTARHCNAKLSYAKRITSVELRSWTARPNACDFKLYHPKPYLRNSYHVARGRGKLFLRRAETQMGPRQFINARLEYVQTRSISLTWISVLNTPREWSFRAIELLLNPILD
jgi:hypothetical protein